MRYEETKTILGVSAGKALRYFLCPRPLLRIANIGGWRGLFYYYRQYQLNVTIQMEMVMVISEIEKKQKFGAMLSDE